MQITKLLRKWQEKIYTFLNTKHSKDPREIREMYNTGIYDVQIAAVTNPYASIAFLEEIILDSSTPKAVSEAAFTNYEKMSST